MLIRDYVVTYLTQFISLIKMLRSYLKHLHWPLNTDKVIWWALWLVRWAHLFFKPLFRCVSTFSLTAFIKTDHYMLPLLSCLPLSLIPSFTTKWKGNPGVSEADWQQRQRWKDEKREGGQMKAKRRNEGENRIKAQPALTVNGVRKGEFVLAAWLVSVRALWEGNWRTTIVELLVRSRTKL